MAAALYIPGVRMPGAYAASLASAAGAEGAGGGICRPAERAYEHAPGDILPGRGRAAAGRAPERAAFAFAEVPPSLRAGRRRAADSRDEPFPRYPHPADGDLRISRPAFARAVEYVCRKPAGIPLSGADKRAGGGYETADGGTVFVLYFKCKAAGAGGIRRAFAERGAGGEPGRLLRGVCSGWADAGGLSARSAGAAAPEPGSASAYF